MQDGAPCHTSKATEKWLETNLKKKGASVNGDGKWPVGSPDINPIENLWNFFQNAVIEHEPKTLEEFRGLLVDVWWNDIPQAYIQKLYASMPRRMNAVINADGRVTKC